MMYKKSILLLLVTLNSVFVNAQGIGSSPEYVKQMTALWKGERSADGRPKVPDLVLDRLRYNTRTNLGVFIS